MIDAKTININAYQTDEALEKYLYYNLDPNGNGSITVRRINWDIKLKAFYLLNK
jgi:hypothetical protein